MVRNAPGGKAAGFLHRQRKCHLKDSGGNGIEMKSMIGKRTFEQKRMIRDMACKPCTGNHTRPPANSELKHTGNNETVIINNNIYTYYIRGEIKN